MTGVQTCALPIWTDDTLLAVYKDGADLSNYRAIVTYRPITGVPGVGRWLYTYITNGYLASYIADLNPPSKTNERQTNGAAGSAAFHVYVARSKTADGTSAVKGTRVDGASDDSGAGLHEDVTGVTHGSYNVTIGAEQVSAPVSYQCKGRLCDVLIAPYLDDATADLVQQCFKSLRGTP